MGTRRLRFLAVAVLLIVVAGQAVAVPAGQQQYIVKTKHVITPPHTTAAPSVQDLVRARGGHVDYEWRDRLVVTLPDAAVQALMQHPAVEFVQKVASGIPEGGTVAAENADPVVTSSAFRPAPKSLPPWTSGTYSYDGEGNITAIGSNAYSYDAFSRLVTSTTNGIPETYTYDRYGNLTQKVTGTGSTALTVQSGVDDWNHLTGHCYDTAGNLTDATDSVHCPTATETHSFDALNMMTMKWNRSAGTKEYYIYNANDERIAVIPCSGTVCTEQITFSFRDESGKVLRQFEVPYQQFDSPWTWVEDYVYRDGILFAAERMPAQGGRRHFHVDHLGTPRLITDNTGHRISEHDYFPFGVEATPLRQDTVSPNNFNREEPMKFTGHERDFTVGTAAENSNYVDYMHARSTVPQWGRFLSVDPRLNLDRALHHPQTWNRYAYVENNPLVYADPTGMNIFKDAWDWAVGLFVREKPENDRARQAQQLAEDPSTGVTQAEANSQKASTYRNAAKEGVTTVGAALTEAPVTAVLFKGIGKGLTFAEGKLASHFAKHAAEFGYTSAGEYLAGGRAVAGEAVAGAPGISTKVRGTDTLIYKAATNEFLVVAKNNVIRTYFKPVEGVTYFLNQ